VNCSTTALSVGLFSQDILGIINASNLLDIGKFFTLKFIRSIFQKKFDTYKKDLYLIFDRLNGSVFSLSKLVL